MCCGSTEPAPSVSSVSADPEGTPADDQKYVVSYFNGTTQEATGLEEVRLLLLSPSARAEGTDRGGFQGGSYARA